MRLSIDRIVVHAADEPVDPRAFRASIQRELARGLTPAAPADRQALARTVGDAVRVAAKGGAR
jgi:hypothetical protein